jgi:hypothetical protein
MSGLPVPLRPCDPVEREPELDGDKVAIVLVLIEWRAHRVCLRRLLTGSERLAQQARRIKPGQGHIIENAADHPSAVVDHLNFELIDDDDLRVGQVRPHKTDVAEHVVGL